MGQDKEHCCTVAIGRAISVAHHLLMTWVNIALKRSNAAFFSPLQGDPGKGQGEALQSAVPVLCFT